MAIPFALPSDEEPGDQDQSQQQLEQLMLDLYAALQQVLRARSAHQRSASRNHRLPRRSGEYSSSFHREHPMLLVDSDLSRLPLPDLVLSAVEQLPPSTPQVTVSAPSSPMRDATFQFPECGLSDHHHHHHHHHHQITTMGGGSPVAQTTMPIPSPRPRPRRRLTSEGSLPEKDTCGEMTPCGVTQGSIQGTCCALHMAAKLDEREWATVGANLRNIADDFHASKTKDAEVGKSRLSFLGSGLSSSSSSILGSGGLSPAGSTDSLIGMLIPAPLRETLWTTLALYLGWRLVSRLR